MFIDISSIIHHYMIDLLMPIFVSVKHDMHKQMTKTDSQKYIENRNKDKEINNLREEHAHVMKDHELKIGEHDYLLATAVRDARMEERVHTNTLLKKEKSIRMMETKRTTSKMNDIILTSIVSMYIIYICYLLLYNSVL